MAGTAKWDYIIVGGGLAGCVVAHRLKQYQPSSRILVIEAGPDVSGNKEILQFSTLNFIGGQFDWGYKTVPQTHLDGRQIHVPAGKALGGGSVINACKVPNSSHLVFSLFVMLNILPKVVGFEGLQPILTAGLKLFKTSAGATKDSWTISR